MRGLLLTAVLSLLVATAALAEPQPLPRVQVQGLFADRAVLLINGEVRLLKVGDRSPEGVTLLASSSREAKIEVGGERQVLTLSRQISSTFRAADKAEVRLSRGADSHYWVRGAINGRSVEMLIDTGASLVAMSSQTAERLGIDYRDGRRSRSQTAGGDVSSYRVVLDKVSLGGIEAYQVPATVLDGDYPRQILLGNSLLSQLDMQEEGSVMVLRQKY